MNTTHISLSSAVAAERIADMHRAADAARMARLATTKPQRTTGRRRRHWRALRARTHQPHTVPQSELNTPSNGNPAPDRRPSTKPRLAGSEPR
jgi:hypothetical protein